VIPIILAIDRYIANLVKSTSIDSRVGRLAIEIADNSHDHLLIDGKSANGLASAYLYFSAILLGVTLPLSRIVRVSEFEIRSRSLLTSFPLMRRPTVVK
jgi:transcription initiation factor TFIIIB Brf1 subunit/transcription initiation factor TFIIB